MKYSYKNTSSVRQFKSLWFLSTKTRMAVSGLFGNILLFWELRHTSKIFLGRKMKALLPLREKLLLRNKRYGLMMLNAFGHLQAILFFYPNTGTQSPNQWFSTWDDSPCHPPPQGHLKCLKIFWGCYNLGTHYWHLVEKGQGARHPITHRMVLHNKESSSGPNVISTEAEKPCSRNKIFIFVSVYIQPYSKNNWGM